MMPPYDMPAGDGEPPKEGTTVTAGAPKNPNVPSATERAARCCTEAKIASRISPKKDAATRSSPALVLNVSHSIWAACISVRGREENGYQ